MVDCLGVSLGIDRQGVPQLLPEVCWDWLQLPCDSEE